MKILIQYKTDGMVFAPYWAYSWVEGEYFACCGDSYAEAKAKLINLILEKRNPTEPIPPAEEVEID